MLQQADSLLEKKTFKKRSLYFSLATSPAHEDKETNMEAGNKEFKKLLEEHQPEELRWQWKFYGNEDHGTVPIPTEYDGLRYIFESYQTQIVKSWKIRRNSFQSSTA